MVEAPLLENNIWKKYKSRGLMVFAITRQSSDVAESWAEQYNLTYPVLYDPDPSETYWKYSHGYIPQNTLSDSDFTVLFDETGYREETLKEVIEENLPDVSVVARIAANGNDVTVQRGKPFRFHVVFKNWARKNVRFDSWVEILKPDHSLLTSSPVLGPSPFTLAQTMEIDVPVVIHIPADIPPGEGYKIRVQIGHYGDYVTNSDLFEVSVGGEINVERSRKQDSE